MSNIIPPKEWGDSHSEPVCPHCGERDQDWWDGLDDNKNDGDTWDVECPFCDEKYAICMSVSTDFTTAKLPPDTPAPSTEAK